MDSAKFRNVQNSHLNINENLQKMHDYAVKTQELKALTPRDQLTQTPSCEWRDTQHSE